jgi:hypothetical protein
MIRVLLVLTLIVHGASLPGAVSDAAAAGLPGHHGTEIVLLPADADHCPDDPPADCCTEAGCDCGCAATAMMSFSVPRPPAAWDHEPSRLPRAGPAPYVRLSAAPFRPPA